MVAEEESPGLTAEASRIDPATLPAASELSDALETAPGVTVRRSGAWGSLSQLRLRGASARQTQIHLDGFPLNPDGVGAVNLGELPVALLSGIDVYRGVAPLSHGSAALGGVVDLRTEGRPAGWQAQAGAGSFGLFRGGVAAQGRIGASGEGTLAVSGGTIRGDFRYFDDNGTRWVQDDDAFRVRQHNRISQGSALGSLRFDLGAHELSSVTLGMARHEQLPGPIGRPSTEADVLTGQVLQGLQLRSPLGSHLSTVQAFVHGRLGLTRDPLGEIGIGGGTTLDTSWREGLTWLVRGAPSHRFGHLVRLSARAEQFTHEGEARHRAVLGAGWEADLHLWDDRLHLRGTVDARWLSDAGDLWAGPRGVVQVEPLPGLVLRAEGGHSFRPPDLTERFGQTGILQGNPDLRPEKGWLAETGLLWREQGGHAELGVTGFGLWSTDRIVFLANAQRSFVPVNFGRTRNLGVEAEARLHWWKLHAQLAVTFQDARDLTEGAPSEGRRLPNVPALATTSHLWLQTAHVRVGHRFRFVGATYTDALNWHAQAPRPLHDVYAVVHPWGEWLALELAVDNLFDTLTQVVPADPLHPGGEAVTAPLTDFWGYPLPGRAFSLTITLRPPPRRHP